MDTLFKAWSRAILFQALDPLLEPLLQKAKFKAGNMIMILGYAHGDP